MGLKPTPKHSLDRYPNKNGNYGPHNCRWADAAQQANNKRNNILYKYKGQKKTLAEWSLILGVSYTALWGRINKKGWSVNKALSTPKIPPGWHINKKKIKK